MTTLSASQDYSHISAIQSASPQAAESLEALTLKFDRLLSFLSKKLAPNTSYVEDLYQQGVIGLIEAISKFDITSGCRLSTFVFPRIKGSMLDFLRREFRQPLSRSTSDHDASDQLDLPEAHQPTHTAFLSDAPLTPEESYTRQEMVAVTYQALMTLSSRQRQVVCLAYLADYRPSEIADKLNISRPRVTALLASGLHGLKREVQLAA